MRRVGIGIWDSRQGKKRGGDLGNEVGLGFFLNSLPFYDDCYYYCCC